ncbi:MAG: two-component sensor histidine kinase [Proteobacteria bacterium]|nr:two-component sensor histidine kinase [Pseudomonadota bacterium]
MASLASSLAGALARARATIVIATLAFAVLVVTGALAAPYALIALAVIAAAALTSNATSATPTLAARGHVADELAIANHVIGAVIAAIPDPLVVFDRDGSVVASNAAARAFAPSLRVNEAVSIAFRMPEIVEAIRLATAGGEARRVTLLERVPVERWSEAIIAPIAPISTAAPVRGGLLVLMIHDLSPLRRVEEMRADFVANASHELRTPLASLSGFIETLQGAARDDAGSRQRFLAIMHEQATRMARLIDDLLSLSRIERDVHMRPQASVDLVLLLRQVADGLQTLARDRGVEISVAAPAEPVVVPGDRDELVRVFENLVENALKYGASGKRVEVLLGVRRSGDGDEATAAVRDYGPGVAREHLPRLTERFYRVDVAESRAQGGTGLGLALVKHSLARHRGHLAIASEPGQGATFTVCLPLARNPPIPAPSSLK